ncbi:MAG: homocysteine S-methyltransferase family protein [Alphaproteobacteria bacterium]
MPDRTESPASPGLMARLAAGPVLCAEGYLFELERRGYLQAGAFVPEVVLEHPEVVSALHREFVHAGSDVVVAFTYYAHREKLRLIGREGDLEPMNRGGLRLARAVARETGTLFAADICNTNIFDPADPQSAREARAMFDEQVAWAADEGADYVIAETFSWRAEAALALAAAQAAGLPVVVTFAIHGEGRTRDGFAPADACRALADAGADVVGLNCIRGPATMQPYLAAVVDAVACPVAALPVAYRTDHAHATFESLSDGLVAAADLPAGRSFPTALDPCTATRYEMAAFARDALAAGVRYIGGCCGTGPHHIRAMAEAIGRRPAASRYSADMSKHYALGNARGLRRSNQDYADRL